MASKAQKLLAKLRQSTRNWNDRDLHAILKGAGFVWRESRHRVYRHPEFPELGSYPLPRGRDLPPGYAKDVLELVERARELYEKRKKRG